uniref:Putative transposon protein n=1 Tax=Phyllostachys edulis TaxID=38705 RepID=D3IVJ5_PHYED|nr:putative transposon protein [Phyllostachys edulis]
MGDYGMDDRHMDSMKGYEEYQGGPKPMGTPKFSPLSMDNNIGGSRRRTNCWKHMTWSQEIQDDQTVEFVTYNYCKAKLTAPTAVGTGHLNRHYKACLRKMAA